MNRRHVIVTGGAKGIGAGICTKLEAEGYTPIVLDIMEPKHQAFGHFEKMDLSNLSETKATLSRLCQSFELLHLVNNVGVVKPASLEKTSAEDFSKIITLNAQVALTCLQVLLPAMRRAHFGRVINVTSRVVLGKRDRTAYSASKGALGAMTRTWALETAGDGITVNAVAPGPIATEAFHQNNPPQSPNTERIIRSVPVQRMGTPADVANAVQFLIADQSSFITGQTLYVCGGITVGLNR
ncbi:MAG: SDR family oxidoreductase [Bacteroidota bacterium]